MVRTRVGNDEIPANGDDFGPLGSNVLYERGKPCTGLASFLFRKYSANWNRIFTNTAK